MRKFLLCLFRPQEMFYFDNHKMKDKIQSRFNDLMFLLVEQSIFGQQQFGSSIQKYAILNIYLINFPLLYSISEIKTEYIKTQVI